MHLFVYYRSLTLRRLGVYELLYQGVSGLRVKAQGVFQGLQVWALLQETLLQATSSSVEVLLKQHQHGCSERRVIQLQTDNYLTPSARG